MPNPNPVDIVKKYNQAWCSKNAEAICEVLAPDCCCTGPGIDVKSAKAFAECVRECNFTSTCENVRYCCSPDGCTVVQCYDWVITSPVKARIPVCEWFTIENGRIKSSCCYFDSACLPKEAAKAA